MKTTFLLMTALFSGAMLCADPAPQKAAATDKPAVRVRRDAHPKPVMEPPVYDQDSAVPTRRDATPEERARREAAHQRRFEIMVLIHACKILPEAQRAPLYAELTRRIQADLDASLAERKAKVAAAEAELARLKAEIAEQEEQKAELVAKELDRLLKLELPPPRGRGEEAPRQ